MNVIEFKDPHELAEAFATLAYTPSWKEKDINIGDVKRLIKDNLRLILQQTDKESAEELQACMLALSARISKESETPEGHDLAFKIMGYAQGIFNPNPKPDWSELPMEILENEIFSHLDSYFKPYKMEGISLKSDLKPLMVSSKKWSELAQKRFNAWVNSEEISLSVYKCKNSKEALLCILYEELSSANLEDFYDFTDKDLRTLIKINPKLTKLKLPIYEVKRGCEKVFKDIKLIAQLTDLTDLHLPESVNEEQLAAILPCLKKLKNLNLTGCNISGQKIFKISNFENIENLDLTKCNNIEEVELAKLIPELKNLKRLRLAEIEQLTGEYLAKMNPHNSLIVLDLSWTGVTVENLTKILSNQENLKNLKISRTLNINREIVAELRTKFPKITIDFDPHP